jgi:hypothetical protein
LRQVPAIQESESIDGWSVFSGEQVAELNARIMGRVTARARSIGFSFDERKVVTDRTVKL